MSMSKPRSMTSASALSAVAMLVVAASGAQRARPATPAAPAQSPQPTWYAWAPKSIVQSSGKAPQKPIWRLSEILAAHKDNASWMQQIVLDKDYDAKYIQMAPGEKTKTSFWADDRIFFVVWSGQIRFTIQGQAPFIATKGFLVQVPFRTPYSMETVGDQPSLRFEVIHSGRTP